MNVGYSVSCLASLVDMVALHYRASCNGSIGNTLLEPSANLTIINTFDMNLLIFERMAFRCKEELQHDQNV